MIRKRPYHPGSLMMLQPGDRGVIVGVTDAAYAVEFLGATAVVLHADVIRVGSTF